MNLRPYQEDAVNSVLTKWENFNKLLLVLPTGAGKTICFSKIAEARKQSGQTLILAHREELLEQAKDKLYQATGIESQIEKAEQRADLDSGVVVASIQTLLSRRERWNQCHFKTIIIDEAHRALAESYQSVLGYFQGSKILGVSATPDRGDKRSLGEYFEEIAYEVGLPQLIRDGYLSPIKARTVPIKIDLSQVRKTAGDFNSGDLGDAIEPHLEKVVDSILSYAANRKILVFLPLIATSLKFTEICKAKGLKAAHVDGNSPDRKEILEAYSKGEYQILSNSMLLTEGYDEPSIDCVICLRPTQSRALYSQIIGRGTRIHPNKENLLILDFLWLTEKHNLVKAARLIARSEDEYERMQKKIESQGEMDLDDAQEETEKDVAQEREESLKRQLEFNKKRSSKFIDPIEFGLSIGDQAAINFYPTMKWHELPPTEGQKKALEGFGLDTENMLRGQAAQLLDVVFARRRNNLATPKQVRLLKKFFYKNPELATFKQANEFLTRKFNSKKVGV